ncbi:ferrous iron transport protein B [Caulobacter vibrioides]|uniref:Ferrous iron transport protein B n=1 Tax=Caulobacter vibrioides (strain NA1000 / CB15N) TaxID=565050 RepID=A0A0H3C5G5_CAUVN|nr:ferrous iron transport protein B [Caulobacter vibrioides]YP_002516122.1 ferrous iron transport protein B [Caulobacter vibrioides NA1000]ACL94214.1 ferrous iron transport protein B [Caulobacter vibrioides NA1000]ATC27553.1 ferrous iron transport protein B [Caulobacter vibrioides]QXZ52792.1 ferrous iron transport protein B [Caulobacter vibrioides]
MAPDSGAAAPPVIDTARIALVGNPNSGKTALFNALTGSRQKVANYAGVTVERKEGVLTAPSGRQIRVLDLPGTYSLRARSPDEVVTRDAVLGKLAGEDAPQALVCVADATNLRLVLRLALELKQVGRPFVLALNMFDIAQRQGLRIDVERLQAEIGAPIVTTVATRKRGLPELLEKVEALVDREALSGDNVWHEPSPAEIRAAHAEAQRIFKLCVKPPERPDTMTGKIDDVLLHPAAGLVILLGLLFVMFQAVFTWATPAMDIIDGGFAALIELTNTRLPQGLLTSFIADGLIAGVGSVLVFLPQILILFFFILLLEDSGYMARAAFLMDKIMGGAGLHGRAFIPLLSSFACAIPGIMSTRVIDNRQDRLTTILVAPLMTCSARIPVYTLIIGAFIPNQTVWGVLSLQGLVMFGLYASGIVSALLVSFVIRRVFWRGAVEPFMMELPTYRWPEPRNVLMNLWTRARIFISRAGRIIMPLMVLVWVLSTFPYPPEGATGPAIDYSIAGQLGQFLAPLMAPIGFNWQMTVALIPGMAAREVAVAVLGTVYAVGGEDGETGALSTLLKNQWSLASALSFLAWYVFAPQCLPTLGVVKRETNSWVWPTVMFVYMVGLAYIAAFITYHVAVALGAG